MAAVADDPQLPGTALEVVDLGGAAHVMGGLRRGCRLPIESVSYTHLTLPTKRIV